MNSITRVGVCTLNQWAMDFELNLRNILKSIEICRQKGILYRVGPELEICGYSCEDHFLEYDTVTHCWETVSEILKHTDDMVVDVGMPVIHKNVFYNCRLICYKGKIHLIRPKKYLADDGNYRESRWFTPWSKDIEDFQLPDFIQKQTNQIYVPIGVAILQTLDTEIGYEICEELWVPQPTSSAQALDGAEIIINSSGSHFQIGKIAQRTDLFKDITRRNGACYLFSNLRGCDGNRLYFDGTSMVAVNGKIFVQSEAFSLHNVEVIQCDVDLQEIRNFRINLKGRSMQASKQSHFPRVKIPINLTQQNKFIQYQDLVIGSQMEISESISCYLWDYLRRSGACGFMLPLSGGLDSCGSAITVYNMCVKIFNTINQQDEYNTYIQVLAELRRIVGDPEFQPKSAEEIVSRLFFTAYIGTEHSSQESRLRSRAISKDIGSTHYEVEIDEICAAFKRAIKPVLHKEPQFEAHGGTFPEDLALQNIQARTRMVMTYLLAQLTPWNNNKQGFLIVLGSSNLDESLRGYLTKYDCSSADINPIGTLTKNDLRQMIQTAAEKFNLVAVQSVLTAQPSAELRPIANQVSEVEMGMTFEELEMFGKLRKIQKLGPVSMFRKLVNVWHQLPIPEVAAKVKRFFTFYGMNRHKIVTLTPSFHAAAHSNDDNRFDFRQFLYNTKWPWQFRKIDEMQQQS